jgi:uncharacterized membrane protein YqjE
MINEVLAQADTMLDTTSIMQSPTSEELEAAAGVVAGAGLLFGGMILLWVVLGLIFLAFLIWWIILLVDLVNRDFEQKTAYIVVMIVGLLLGFVWLVDLIYYFSVVKKDLGSKK